MICIYHCFRRDRNGVFLAKNQHLRFGQNDKLLLSKSVKYFYAGIEEEINVSEYVWFLTRLSDVWSWPRRDNSMIRLLATCRCTVVVFVFSIYCVCFCICICSVLYMYCMCICKVLFDIRLLASCHVWCSTCHQSQSSCQ